MAYNILVVDDDAFNRDSLVNLLTTEGYTTDSASDGDEAYAKISDQQFDLVISDIKMPKMDGITLLKKASQLQPETFFIIITAHGALETAVNALRLGAFDYIAKPLELEDVVIKVRKLFEHKKLLWENKTLKEELQSKYDFSNLIGASSTMLDIFESIKKVAKTDGNVLITGKSGTGKEVIARTLHYNSNRSNNKFVAINCGAIAETLVESELFGYKKGAFTGAARDKKGFFEEANKGTLFLDEIGAVPVNVQAKLLRAIETKEIIAVGSTTSVPVDVRIVAASNIDFQKAIEAEEFRVDLYYRLNVIEINLPSLSERKEDIPLLVNHFVRKYSQEMNKLVKGVDNQTMKTLVAYDWKGEIRELENAIERAIIFCDNDVIGIEDLPPNMREGGASNNAEVAEILKDAMRSYERRHITRILSKYSFDKDLAAKALDISISSLYRKMDDLSITV